MNNNQMIVKKEGIFSKIKKFFKAFFGNDDYEVEETVVSKEETIKKNTRPQKDQNNEVYIPKEIKIENRKSALNPEEEHEISKKEILELYENSKKGDIDLFEIETEKLEKMTALLEEEIKLKKQRIEEKKKKLIA